MSQAPSSRDTGIIAVKTLRILLLSLAFGFLTLHALHLSADFPNHSPWMDWAKYTDEGWYGDAAIRHFQRGSWYLPGDFNPAVALPVWPLIEAVLFRFTGVTVVAARALTVGIFALILLFSYLLLDRWHSLRNPAARRPTLAPAIAVLLLAVNPFCYAFTRLAILEPLLILFTLVALYAASWATPQQETVQAVSTSNLLSPAQLRQAAPVVALGLLFPLMVLTKTTAIFLLPSIVWLLWARAGYALRPLLRTLLPAVALAAILWLGYYALVVRLHFLSDFLYLFDANDYTGINPNNAFSVFGETIFDGRWIGYLLYPLSLIAVGIALVVRPRLLRNPLVPALILWASGYAAFLAYHNNLQPRYYLVVAIPLTLLVPLVLEDLWEDLWATPNPTRTTFGHIVPAAAILALATVVVTDARQTLHYVRTPEYTFTRAASQIQKIIAADHAHNPLVLSISGSNLSLMTGVPSICDDFGTLDLVARVRAYNPGWYVAWNQVEDDKMDALTPTYHLERVAAFPAMDDPERNLLILYRLDPAVPLAPQRKAAPGLFQTGLAHSPARVHSPAKKLKEQENPQESSLPVLRD
jgi:hypothetical protein